MEKAINELLDTIRADYLDYTTRGAKGDLSDVNRQMIADFNVSLTVKPGRNYIKIIRGGSVWGFVVATENDKKFRQGDILKAAGWAAPARNHARGNVLDGGYSVQWTGPHYM